MDAITPDTQRLKMLGDASLKGCLSTQQKEAVRVGRPCVVHHHSNKVAAYIELYHFLIPVDEEQDVGHGSHRSYQSTLVISLYIRSR